MCSWISTKNLQHHLCRRLYRSLSAIATVSPLSPVSFTTFELNTQLKDLIQSGRLLYARKVFDETSQRERDQITWTTLIKAYLTSSNPLESLYLFKQLHSDSALVPDQFLLSLALKASASSPSLLTTGESVHAHCVKCGELPSSVFVATALLDMYSRSDPSSPAKALHIFDEMPLKSVVSWTAAINALERAGRCHDAVRWLAAMRRANMNCDSHTYATVFKACANAGLISRGREVHSQTIKAGLDSTSFVANTLATMYSKCGDPAQALLVFERMHIRDVVSWTSAISTYAQMGRQIDAVRAFITMQGDGVWPNEHTYVEVVAACSGFNCFALGEQLHARVTRLGFVAARAVANALVTFYSRTGRLNSADMMFEEISSKDIVSWSSIISAYAQEGHAEESFLLFSQMRRAGIFATEFQLASLLSSCAAMAVLDAGRQVHALMIASGVESDPKISSALINMYSKCGMISEAHRVFDDLRPENVVSWTAMINGYAEHGHCDEAIRLFNSMMDAGLEPDRVAYIGVLTACSHAGLVDLGLEYFETMKEKHKMEPWKEHYGCIVDMFARAGRLREAEEVIEAMQEKADEVVWTAVLRACAVHGDTELGQRAAQRVLELDPECAGVHISLSNMYAAKGRWGDAALMRRALRAKGVRKEAGWSWIGVGDGSVSVFTAGDRSNAMKEDVYGMLELVYSGAKMEEGFELEIVI